MVEVLKTGASLRVNDHERLYANFSRPLVKDLDFDSYMTIGASDNNSVGEWHIENDSMEKGCSHTFTQYAFDGKGLWFCVLLYSRNKNIIVAGIFVIWHCFCWFKFCCCCEDGNGELWDYGPVGPAHENVGRLLSNVIVGEIRWLWIIEKNNTANRTHCKARKKFNGCCTG